MAEKKNEIVPVNQKAENVRLLLEKAKPQIRMALPRHLDADRMLRIAMTSVRRTPALLGCNQQSLLGAVMQAAQLGLEPDGVLGLAYLIPFKDEAHAIELANDIQYGLSSYVWTENIGKAHRVAAAVEAGMCFVNSQNVRDLRQPFGGTKASGTGREGGTWSYEVFLEPKNVAVSLGSHHIPHWGV